MNLIKNLIKITLSSAIFFAAVNAQAKITGLNDWPKEYQERIKNALDAQGGDYDISTRSTGDIFSTFQFVEDDVFAIVFPLLMNQLTEEIIENIEKRNLGSGVYKETSQILRGVRINQKLSAAAIAAQVPALIKEGGHKLGNRSVIWEIASKAAGLISFDMALDLLKLEPPLSEYKFFVQIIKDMKVKTSAEVFELMNVIISLETDPDLQIRALRALVQNPTVFNSERSKQDIRKEINFLTDRAIAYYKLEFDELGDVLSARGLIGHNEPLLVILELLAKDLGTDLSAVVRKIFNFSSTSISGSWRVDTNLYATFAHLIFNPSLTKIDDILLKAILNAKTFVLKNGEYGDGIAFLKELYEQTHLTGKTDLLERATFHVITSESVEAFFSQIDEIMVGQDRLSKEKVLFESLEIFIRADTRYGNSSERFAKAVKYLMESHILNQTDFETKIDYVLKAVEIASKYENRAALILISEDEIFKNEAFYGQRAAISLFLIAGDWEELRADLASGRFSPVTGGLQCSSILGK